MASQHSDRSCDEKSEHDEGLNPHKSSTRSSRNRKRGTEDDGMEESKSRMKLKSRKIDKEGQNQQSPNPDENEKSHAETPTGRRRRQDSSLENDGEDATINNSGQTRRRIDSAHEPTPISTTPQSTTLIDFQPRTALIPPPNNISPFSRLSRELRQMILYRVLDSDQEVANRYPLQFSRLATAEERRQAIRFRLLRQRRDALLRVEEEWGEVGLLWSLDAEYIFQVVWGELMRAEPEVFG